MSSRKSKAKKKPSLAAQITAATSGKTVDDQAPVDLVAEATSNRKLLDLSKKIPTPSRSVTRHALKYAESYAQYLEDRGGEQLVSSSMAKNQMGDLLSDYIAHQVSESARKRGFDGDLVAQFAQGDASRTSEARRYIAATTVIDYRKKAFRVVSSVGPRLR